MKFFTYRNFFAPKKAQIISWLEGLDPAIKRMIIMRINLIACLISLTIMNVCASVHGQSISLNFQEATFTEVLATIKKQSGYQFLYNNSEIKKAKAVSVNIKNASLKEVLDKVFKDQPLTYEIIDRTIVIMPKKADEKKAANGAIEIIGKVVDKENQPIPGVTVNVKGTTLTRITGPDGLFNIALLHNSATLVFSFIGYVTKEVDVNNSVNDLVVTLEQSIGQLDQVQVIGYGTVTRRLNTGSVSSIKSSDIANQTSANPLSALQGRVSGLYIAQQSGVPGTAFSVKLRGQNSISSGNTPLYIIDGVPLTSTSITDVSINTAITGGGNPLMNINTMNIESIEVLKDADATAIYGSRGANGVVLITTKKGKAGKVKIDFELSTGAGKVAGKMDLLNTQQYVQVRKEAFANDGIVPNATNARDLILWRDTTRYTDWQKLLIGETARSNNVQLNISGGNENTQFLIGGGYLRETTVFPGDFNNGKASANFNLIHQTSDKKLKLLLSSSYVDNSGLLPSEDITWRSLTLPPNAPSAYTPEGKLYFISGFNNPYVYLDRKYDSGTASLSENFKVDYQLIPELILSISSGFNKTNSREMRSTPISSLDPAGVTKTGSSSFSNNSIRTWIIEPQVNFKKNIGAGVLSVLIGSTFQEDLRRRETFNATGFTSDELLANIASASAVTVQGSNYSRYRYNALFGRINYNWKESLLFNITARRDGSSRFGPEKQFANFGALGVGWIFSNLTAFKNAFDFISFGKIRSSYGITGNDQIGDYQYLETFTPTQYAYQGISGIFSTSLFNPDFGWETNKKLEFGLELGFIRDKIFFNASYYRNRSSDQLVGYPLPLITGGASIQANLPATVQNTGWEFELNSTNISNADFNWTSSFNISLPKNILVSYPNIEASTYKNQYTVGQSIFSVKKIRYVSVDPTTGVYQFVDQNFDGAISSPEDLSTGKDVSQQFYGGIENRVRYKNWSFSCLFQFVKQLGRNYMYSDFVAPGRLGNQPALVLERWQNPGDHTNIQKFTQANSAASSAYTNSQFYGDNVFSDASFIRLRNVSLSYTFSEAVLKGIKLFNLNTFLQGQNLFTITDFIGLDPETQNNQRVPPLRTVTLGLRISI
jgi:TonB-linked SusC/RagA family outer membrane protein